jgi:hypothetical protein
MVEYVGCKSFYVSCCFQASEGGKFNDIAKQSKKYNVDMKMQFIIIKYK